MTCEITGYCNPLRAIAIHSTLTCEFGKYAKKGLARCSVAEMQKNLRRMRSNQLSYEGGGVMVALDASRTHGLILERTNET